MFRSSFALALAFFAVGLPQARAAYINGYAVGDHHACNLPDLPAAPTEVRRFFASPSFPGDMAKNAFWTDSNVRERDWNAKSSFFAAPSTVSGHDGVDSGLVAYLATYGSTENGQYTAAAGGAGNCLIRGAEIGAGAAKARYLVLSTSESVKIGSGDEPQAAGDNPIATWKQANKGLNCIFGYSNDMEDTDTYGEYFLDTLATTDLGLVDAFFAAAARAAPSNVPAALCFGTDDAAARDHLASAKTFTDEHFGSGGAAYRYSAAHILDGAFAPPRASGAILPRVVLLQSRALKPTAIAKSLLGSAYVDASPGPALRVYRSPTGTVTYDQRTNVLNWQRERRRDDLSHATALKDSTVTRVALDFLVAKGVVHDPAELLPTNVIDQAASGSGSAPIIFEKTVVFHQRLHGSATTLGSAGQVQVAVNAEGDVTGLNVSLVNATMPRLEDWVDGGSLDLAAAKAAALQALQRRLPDANLAVLGVRVGYDAGDQAAPLAKSRLVAEVMVQAEQGHFRRRYAEKIRL